MHLLMDMQHAYTYTCRERHVRYIYTYMYNIVCIYIYIYGERERDRQRERDCCVLVRIEHIWILWIGTPFHKWLIKVAALDVYSRGPPGAHPGLCRGPPGSEPGPHTNEHIVYVYTYIGIYIYRMFI